MGGRPLPTVVSQLVAYSDGQVGEVARDFHAQADDGSVWHFGEDSANYDDGVLVDHEGSWLAGRDGPPALVMPAQPQVAAVFGSHTSPGQGDEVTVQAADQVVEGPQGPVAGPSPCRSARRTGRSKTRPSPPATASSTPGSRCRTSCPAWPSPCPPTPSPGPSPRL